MRLAAIVTCDSMAGQVEYLAAIEYYVNAALLLDCLIFWQCRQHRHQKQKPHPVRNTCS